MVCSCLVVASLSCESHWVVYHLEAVVLCELGPFLIICGRWG